MQPVKMLLIEDDPGDADLLQELLSEERSYVYILEWVEHLQTGLERLALGGIDVVLLDLSLPDSHGLDTFTAVNTHAPALPTIVLSGLDDETIALEAVRQGAQDYLVKGQVDGRIIVRVIRYAIERNSAEEALRESEARFRGAFDHAAIGMAMVATDGHWMEVNDVVCEIVGYTRDELLAMSFQDITHPDDLQTDLGLFYHLLAGETNYYHLEKRYIHKLGQEIWVQSSASLVRNIHKQPLYAVVQIQDITRRKRVEEELAHRLEELARSNAELEQFAYVASHDLQEPLRMVASYTQLLARRYQGRLDSDADEFIDYAVTGVLRMQQLINDLLTYAQVGTRGRDFEATDCEAIFAQTLVDLQTALNESNAEITRDPLPMVMADPAQLRQVFQNLLGNAIKFRSTMPLHIHVSAERKGEVWVFSVSDNGIGLDPEYAERIFVIFQRLHGREQYLGTGIGLSICKKIIERHGGHIWVSGQAGQGATFYFTIPVHARLRPRLNSIDY